MRGCAGARYYNACGTRLFRSNLCVLCALCGEIVLSFLISDQKVTPESTEVDDRENRKTLRRDCLLGSCDPTSRIPAAAPSVPAYPRYSFCEACLTQLANACTR